jgi:hypothetical protein
MHMHDEDVTTKAARGNHPRNGQDSTWQATTRAVAAGVLRGNEPKGAIVQLQRLAGNSGVGTLMSKDSDDERSPVLDVVGHGGGAPLPTGVRSDMEAHLGADLGAVRIHDGEAAAESARAVDAKAYTVGNDVVFGRGAFDPTSEAGRHTLAHELTHVVQQRAGPVDATPAGGGIAVSHPEDRFEREAEATASTLQRGGTETSSVAGARTTDTVQRQEVPEEEEEIQTAGLQRQTDDELEQEETTPEG